MTHVIAAENKGELEVYINKLYSLLQEIYKNKILQMNADKTAFMTIETKHDKDNHYN